MAHDQFLVSVAADILVVELAVEVRIDGRVQLVFLGPDGVEFRAGCLAAFLALFGEAFHAQDFGVGVGFGPFAEEDVVLEVERGEVLYIVAEFLDGAADFVGQGGRGEDGEGAILEADWRHG